MSDINNQKSYWDKVASIKTFTHPLDIHLVNKYIQPADVILDYGCGYGALYPFLSARYRSFQYTGFDLSEKMIEASQHLYPATNAKWEHQEKLLKSHDYVIASGIFNVKMQFNDKDWFKYVLDTLNTINSIAEKGFSFNALTSYSDAQYMKSELFYPDPGVIFDHCKRNFSKMVAVLHDYPLYEFSIIVRK